MVPFFNNFLKNKGANPKSLNAVADSQHWKDYVWTIKMCILPARRLELRCGA
jgi:hypothetical protein